MEAESELGQLGLGSESRMQGNLSFDGESSIVDGEFKPSTYSLKSKTSPKAVVALRLFDPSHVIFSIFVDIGSRSLDAIAVVCRVS